MDSNCDFIPFHSYEEFKAYFERCAPPNSTNKDMLSAVLNEMSVKSQAQLGNIELGILISVYVMLMVFGACGSALVIYTVVHRHSMRSARNMFIVNLAISDLVLCTFTEPFNLIRLLSLHHEWILGDTMCKLSAMFQGTNIFVSTISITAIAVDRFQVIIHPTITSVNIETAVKMLVTIWVLSLILSSPLTAFSKVKLERHLQCTEKSQNINILTLKLIYSMISAIIQYVAPLFIVVIVYTRICIRIRSRMNPSAAQPLVIQRQISNSGQKLEEGINCQLLTLKRSKRIIEEKRKRRTNILLASIALVFALSWLPLISFNLLMDMKEMKFYMTSNDASVHSQQQSSSNLTSIPINSFLFPISSNLSSNRNDSPEPLSGQTVFLIQAACLLAVLSSACINPILYGWLNENFRKEFKIIFRIKEAHQGNLNATKELQVYSKVNSEVKRNN